ncbi:hypothetical protein [Allochromatium palmeri]|uniref:Uncharacterized protein n=1 Tax=Allochromatium palmeri TaxID=231048 RepID=A0A6N8EEW5_9GAMM|nr:hypothetical protein [Allochromatium palmeri]MTW21638.1 hypothetical protein [Allochromatium palmeri]
MNNRLESGLKSTQRTGAVVESISAHWQNDRLLLELVSDPKTCHWSVSILNQSGDRRLRQITLSQALNTLACRARTPVQRGADTLF